ncbi:MAG: hypothetical protein BGO95_04685 [Micrococcales bacterium 73-13]|nr:MAG: hypothetical protein BGO95_04685 [Micrococcales bacterium 73-13]
MTEPDPFDQLIRPQRARRTAEGAEPSRRRGWVRIMLAVVIPLVVIVGGVAVADLWARAALSDPIRNAVAAGFRLQPSAVSVDLGGDLAIVQLLNGRLQRVTATSDGVELSGAHGRLLVTLSGVGTDRSLPVESMEARIELRPDVLGPIVGEITGLEPSAVAIVGSDVRVTTVLDLGIVGQFDADVELRPSAGPGSISFAPTMLELEGQRVPAANIRALPVLGEFIAPLLGSREHCIADQVPMALSVDRFAVDEHGATVVLRGTGVIVDETLARTGLCS